MPAESLNCPPRSNVSTAKDNNNIHRSPSVVNRSTLHRPHCTKFGRPLSAKSTIARRKETILSAFRAPAHMPERHSLCAPATALTKHKDWSARVQVRKTTFSYIARKSGTGGNCGGRRATVNARVRLCVVYKRSSAEDEGRWCEADVRWRRLF